MTDVIRLSILGIVPHIDHCASQAPLVIYLVMMMLTLQTCVLVRKKKSKPVETSYTYFCVVMGPCNRGLADKWKYTGPYLCVIPHNSVYLHETTRTLITYASMFNRSCPAFPRFSRSSKSTRIYPSSTNKCQPIVQRLTDAMSYRLRNERPYPSTTKHSATPPIFHGHVSGVPSGSSVSASVFEIVITAVTNKWKNYTGLSVGGTKFKQQYTQRLSITSCVDIWRHAGETGENDWCQCGLPTVSTVCSFRS